MPAAKRRAATKSTKGKKAKEDAVEEPMIDTEASVDTEEDGGSVEETPHQSEDAVQSAKESLLNTLEQMERDVAQKSEFVEMNGDSAENAVEPQIPSEDPSDVKPPLPPMDPSGQEGATGTETNAIPAEPISITIEEDHKIYVAPKRRTMALNDSLLSDMQTALKEGGVNIVEVQGLKRTHAFLKVKSVDDIEKACSEFDDKVVAGLTWLVKRRIGKAELHNVSFKPSNALIKVDDEMTQDVMNHVKDEFNVLRHYSTRDQKEIIIGLENEEDQEQMVSKYGKCVIGHIEYVVSPKEDVTPEVSDDPDTEPFMFASIRGDDTKMFDESLMNCIKKLMEDDGIELKRSIVTSNGRFSFFYFEKWEDTTKFVEKYDNKIINNCPLHFEKGQPKSQRENRYKNSRDSFSPAGKGRYSDQ